MAASSSNLDRAEKPVVGTGPKEGEAPLSRPARFLRGAGPARGALLEKLGLKTVEDVLFHLPRDLIDLRHVVAPADLVPDKTQSVRGVVVDVEVRSLSRGRMITAVLVDCGGQYVRGVWFNQPWVSQRYSRGQHVLWIGKPRRRSGRWEFAHPQCRWLEEDQTDAGIGLLPCYPLTEGLRMDEMRRIVRNAVDDYASLIADPLPQHLRERLDLPPLAVAVAQVHRPESPEQYRRARRRIVFDDLFEFQIGRALKHRFVKRQGRAPVLQRTTKIDARIRRLFPFRFTPGQDRAIEEICRDLASHEPMHRLLQADVGAGKTCVALYGMLLAVACGYQAVLMAPTEVLAEQHWNTAESLLAHSRVRRCRLTGRLPDAERRELLAQIRNGQIDLIVGTHAVIQKDVVFSRLGLVVIDEQHKFGVRQRARFAQANQIATNADEPATPPTQAAGESVPHVLVMTATPIPRSLCLVQYGDLDLSTIDDLPPGRQPVVTRRIATEADRRRMWDFLRERLAAGRQLYVVCPRIGGDAGDVNADDDSGDSSASAEAVYRRLVQGELQGVRIGLVHGRLPSAEIARTMRDFREGRLQALVTTTIVEVGMDVPNATLMVVEQAERFGLSQLHQLRGRVVRGTSRGYCFLVSETTQEEARKRLAALESTSDGFRIAELDLQIRGPGDLLGTRQHGDWPLRFADPLRDAALLEKARTCAFELVESGEIDRPEMAPLKIRVLERFAELMDLPQSG